MPLDYSKITDVELDGIDRKDYPDFTDAHITSATYDGRAMTDEELDELNEDHGYVHEKVFNHIF